MGLVSAEPLNAASFNQPSDDDFDNVSQHACTQYNKQHDGAKFACVRLFRQVPDDKAHEHDEAANHQRGDPGLEDLLHSRSCVLRVSHP